MEWWQSYSISTFLKGQLSIHMTLSNLDSANLLLIGNSFFDVIVETDYEENARNQRCNVVTRLGGIFNVSRKLKNLRVPHDIATLLGGPLSRESSAILLEEFYDEIINLRNIKYSRQEMCLASIFVNRRLSMRTSYVRRGVGQYFEVITQVNDKIRFIHISYLDYLVTLNSGTLDNWNKAGLFVSADLCINDYTDSERLRVKTLIRHLSLLLLSENEYEALFQAIPDVYHVAQNDMLPMSAAIHFQDQLIIKEGKEISKISGVKYQNVSSLGFGDNFVAYFLSSFLDLGDISEALKASFAACQADARGTVN
jgi:sugar/nucleoside kinase (ribokinase family)